MTEDIRAPYADLAPRIEDFGGHNFRIFVHDGTKYDSDEESGDTVNDAISQVRNCEAPLQANWKSRIDEDFRKRKRK